MWIGKNSFLSTNQINQLTPKVNFKKLESNASTDDYEAIIPVSLLMEMNARLSNTIYGYFIGKVFPVVENYVYNAWGNTLCNDSWGSGSYVRAMIEVNAESELKDSIIVVVPNLPKKIVEVQDEAFQTLKSRKRGTSGYQLTDGDTIGVVTENVVNVHDNSDSEDVKDVYNEARLFKAGNRSTTQGASTPLMTVSNV
ncbi:hypothetical protein Tco_0770245 [Tanacetum coccineum]|uniref:Uncharacterized protein n=1 Tax=Tanacetum coccineum TaxID=301880 RepID=A0ABQ4ZBN7_9ASTR